MMQDLQLARDRSGLLVIDFQDKLVKAMPADRAERATRNVLTLLEAARRFGLPVVATEQYPGGLGHTIAPVAEALGALAPPVAPVEKLEFSALGAPAALAQLQAAAVRSWIVVGMETHVCVYQSVRALTAQGLVAHVVADACLSRHEDNWQRGLELMARAGAVVTSTEIVVFDLLERAGNEDFKALSKLIR